MHEQRVSQTATKIGRFMVFMQGHPVWGPLLPDGSGAASEAMLAGSGLLKPWHVRTYRSWCFGALVGLADRVYRGGMMHFALRKRLFDDEAHTAIASGARQVLVVGAGFDTLCVRLAAEHPDVVFVEVDHPATHGAKAKGVEAAGLHRPNLHLVPADLAKIPLAEVLETLEVWDPSAHSYVVAEGLLMYLPPDAVRQFFETVAQHTGPGTVVGFSYVLTDDKGRIGGDLGWLLRTSLRAIGERVTWGPRRGELQGLLEHCGLVLREPIDLTARYLTPASLPTALPNWELFALAHRK